MSTNTETRNNQVRYDFRAIEQRWQERWESERTFGVPNPGAEGFDASRPKYYVLDMFPYPSGVGLHVGHPLGYIATDIVSRYKRMKGFNVMHPMGFDSFGLPAEQYAVEHGVHPRITTEQNIANMLRQLKSFGLSYDWDRSLATTDVEYYRWTQWIFLQLFNSYFDPGANAARPIEELEQKLASEIYCVGFEGDLVAGAAEGLDAVVGTPFGAVKWHELFPSDQAAFLDNHRLAYLAEVPVNWCPALGTVLANEEVTNEGRSDRGNHPVYKRPLRQWMLRITAFADRLLSDLDIVDWPEPIKLMQRNWIGRSEGAMVDFPVQDADDVIRVFTTRPDTLFGATYMVLAPEHPLVDQVTADARRQAVTDYQQQTESRSDVDRMAETHAKTGVDTGAFAINPTTGKPIPIWIADYVLMGYGTGAIMAVPAHDQRDHDFARTFDLPITQVIEPPDDVNVDFRDEAYSGDGVNIRSANDEVSLDGLPTPEAKRVITEWLESKDIGCGEVQFKLRDWLFSRQRYWGEPFPILHDPDGRLVAVDESELPVVLPELEDFTPQASDDPDAPPLPPLSRAPDEWKYVERDGVRCTREFNTMPQWAGSCWYYLRFIDRSNNDRMIDPDIEKYWMQPAESARHSGKDAETPGRTGLQQAASGGVDLYVGGVEHAVLHLLYSRFWHKVLYDLGHVSTPEPFGRLFNQGYIQAYGFQDERGIYVDAEKIEQRGDEFFFEGQPVTRSLGKMGKSLKNAVNPDDVIAEFGCDTLRLYEMYMGPLDASKPWNTEGLNGQHRFLQRLWRNFIDESGQLRITDDPPTDAQLRLTHQTIKRVTDDMERLSANTAIAALIELNNTLVGQDTMPRFVAETFLLLLAPMAPHISEELWQRIGHDTPLSDATWPTHDEQYLVEDQVELAVQVMGKNRARITVPADADEKAIEEAALADERIAELLAGKTLRKVIVVPGSLVNIVAN